MSEGNIGAEDEEKQPAGVSRRTVLAGLGGFVGAIFTGAKLSGAFDTPEAPPIPQEVTPKEKEYDYQKSLEDILLTPLDPWKDPTHKEKGRKQDETSPYSRYNKEKLYVIRAKTLEQINEGLKIVMDPSLRAELLDLRWKERERGNPRLRKLIPADLEHTERFKQLNKGKEINKETLATVIQKREEAKEILQKQITAMEKKYPGDAEAPQKAWKDFLMAYRPDIIQEFKENGIPISEITLDNLLINIQGALNIVQFETGLAFDEEIYGYVNAGSEPIIETFIRPAKDLKDKDAKNKAIQAIDGFNQEFSAQGLPYSRNRLIGSHIAGDFGSIHFAPESAWNFRQKAKKMYNLPNFDPRDVDMATLGMFLYLFDCEPIRNESGDIVDFRYGYAEKRPGNSSSVFIENIFTVRALEKWNKDWAKEHLKAVKFGY